MAQSERFYFWRGYYDALRMLPTPAQRGELVTAMCAYAFEGEDPSFSDPTLAVVWQVVRDQVRESVEIGREMSRRGRRSGESRRGAKGGEHSSNTVPNSAPNEEKGTEVNCSGDAPSLDAQARAADAGAEGAPTPPADPMAAFGRPEDHELPDDLAEERLRALGVTG